MAKAEASTGGAYDLAVVGAGIVGLARACIVEAPASDVRVVSVTSGTGMSTAFAIGEEVIAELTAA